MAKVLMLNPEKCSGCRTCELACSFKHNQEFRPSGSRVSVLTWESVGVSVPIMCMQCDTAACMKVCPSGALSKSAAGAVVINHERCTRCRMCIMACPFGTTTYDAVTKSIIKCDLCDGEPECAKFCPSGAITFCEATAATRGKKKAYAARFKDLIQEVSE